MGLPEQTVLTNLEGVQKAGSHPHPTSSLPIGRDSNDNASETKANESFDNGVFFDIEAKRTPLLDSKLFLKRSDYICITASGS
jgi:hypothetical protein